MSSQQPHFVISSNGTFKAIHVQKVPGFRFKDPYELVKKNICVKDGDDILDCIIESFHESLDEAKIEIRNLLPKENGNRENLIFNEDFMCGGCVKMLNKVDILEKKLKETMKNEKELLKRLNVIEALVSSSRIYEKKVSKTLKVYSNN